MCTSYEAMVEIRKYVVFYQVRKELSMCYDNFTQYHVDIQACANLVDILKRV